MRPRLTYANVAATLALVFSISGGALAAQHYVITRVSQISPTVRAQLRGARGPRGPQASSVDPAGQQGQGVPAGSAGGSASSENLCGAIGEAAVLASERDEAGLETALGTIYENGCGE
jgi:hypothetical protein